MGKGQPAAEARPAGVMVAVNTETQNDDVAIGVLRASAARMIERAEGAWRDGKWVDFDPVRAPDIVESRVADIERSQPRQP
jgi:hypothetical protein